jgi:hypothetical protein
MIQELFQAFWKVLVVRVRGFFHQAEKCRANSDPSVVDPRIHWALYRVQPESMHV